jgi:hypothetical protein
MKIKINVAAQSVLHSSPVAAAPALATAVTVRLIVPLSGSVSCEFSLAVAILSLSLCNSGDKKEEVKSSSSSFCYYCLSMLKQIV